MDLDSVDLGDDASFMSAFAKSSGVKGGKTLRTSGSDNSDNGIAMTSYTVADILQGAHAYKPPGLSANAFNQVLTSQLKRTASLNEDGGLDGDIVARLGSRKRFLPDDLMNGSFLDSANNAGSSYDQSTNGAPTTPANKARGNANDINKKYTDTSGVSGQRSAESPDGKSIMVGTYIDATLNMSVIASWKAMVDAANKEDVIISGQVWGGYREHSRQIELRRQHCGTSHYAVYEMPSGSCHPPTAIPGHSQHEWGMAVDVGNCHKGGQVFEWLAKNASKYGWYNLPSENWHWSVNGN